MLPEWLVIVPLLTIVPSFTITPLLVIVPVLLTIRVPLWGTVRVPPAFTVMVAGQLSVPPTVDVYKRQPYSLVEAATIDGASETAIFFKVMCPVMKPVFSTSVLISFLTSWGLWLPVLMLSKDMSTYTLAAMLVNLNSDLGVDLSQTAALSTVVTIPVVLIFLLTQRKVMEGIAAGSVKG